MSPEAMCQVARNNRCCYTGSLGDVACISDLSRGPKRRRAVKTEQSDCEDEGYTWCPRPEPAEPAEDLDGATVGTIVVASLIGVALVGGAVAIYSGVAGV